MNEVSHKITHKLKPLNYHNVEQILLLYSNILIKRGILTLKKKMVRYTLRELVHESRLC